MIPILFEKTEKEFTTNGLGRLADAISCIVNEERNGIYELTMTYPVNGSKYHEIMIDRIILARPADGKDPQPFRIYQINSPLSGIITINAEHISYMLNKIVCLPFDADNCSNALDGLKLNAVGDCPFDFMTDKKIDSRYSQSEPATIRSRLGGVEGSILSRYKGEYEFDGWNVKLWKHRGTDTGVTIRYGKNLTDLTQEESIQNTYTGIVPYWANTQDETRTIVTLPEKALYCANSAAFPYERTIPVDMSDKFEEEPTIEQLRAAGESYIVNNNIGIPEVTLTVSFVALWQTEQYKDVAMLQRVNLCDTISVYFPSLGVSAKAKIIATNYDVLLDRYNELTIGDAQGTLAGTIADTTDAVKEAVKESKSAFDKSIGQATAQITGALGGHVVINRNADGEPNEILIMDTDSVETAVNVIRMNEAGIGFSTNGYSGPFNSAWSINGTFDAGQINVVNFAGEYLTAGQIADKQLRNYWNLDTGVLVLNAESATVGGSNVETQETTEELRDSVSTLSQHMKWDPDRGLSITTNDGMEVLLTSSKMAFLQNGIEVAYISNQELFITDARILSSITIGEFKFLPRSNGNLSFVYVGGN